MSPAIQVPDSFTWTIQYANVNDTDAGGLVLGDPIGVGESFNDFWEKNSAGEWTTKVFPSGASKANFVAQVTAVPEPGTLALVAAAGSLLLALRRRL
ncbi:MAG: PEP-CTERM sorting domain-containing protein [Pedosphaera sp.]|nr:PEP-CTERM sorting domain-containing protein [Pedosphaera sp.]